MTFFLTSDAGRKWEAGSARGGWWELADFSTLCAALLSSILHHSGLVYVYKLLQFRVWKKTSQLQAAQTCQQAPSLTLLQPPK